MSANCDVCISQLRIIFELTGMNIPSWQLNSFNSSANSNGDRGLHFDIPNDYYVILIERIILSINFAFTFWNLFFRLIEHGTGETCLIFFPNYAVITTSFWFIVLPLVTLYIIICSCKGCNDSNVICMESALHSWKQAYRYDEQLWTYTPS